MVEDPAINSGWVAFSKQAVNYTFVDKEKKMLYGAVMIPNKQIIRVNEAGETFYVVFKQPTINKMVEKFMSEGRTREFNLGHDPNSPAGVSVVESWIIEDEANDKSNAIGLSDLPKGTWVIGAKVLDKDLWGQIKEGAFTGFSLEGFFTEQQLFNKQTYMAKSEKSFFRSMLNTVNTAFGFNEEEKETELAMVEVALADGGVILWDDESQAVFAILEDGTQGEALADGSYELADGRTIEVANGVVANIVEADTAEAEAMQKIFEAFTEKINALESQIGELTTNLSSVVERVDTFEKGTSKEKFSKANPSTEATPNRKKHGKL